MSCVGRHSSAANEAARYSSNCSAAGSAMPSSRISQRCASAPVGSRAQARRDRRAQAGHRRGQFVAAARRLAEPERDGGRLAMRVLHPDDAALDAHDAVGVVAELEYVAGQALDGKVLVDAADRLVLGFQHHLVVGGVRNRAARGQCGQSRAAPAAQHVVDGIVMDQRAAPAAAGGEPLGQHVHDGGEFLARQRAVRPGAAQAVVQRRLGPVLCRDFGNDLLGQHVERLVRNGQPIEFAAPDAVQQCRAFHQIVARLREQPALRQAADGVAGATDALQKARDRTRRAELAHQIHIADVDAEFQRRGRHQRFEFAALQPLLGGQALFLRQAAVMRGDRRLAQAIRQLARYALGHASRVDEHQRGAVRLDQLHQLVVDLLPDVGGHHRFQRRLWHFKPQIAWALMAGIDDGDVGGGLAVRCRTDQQVRDRIDRILCRRQADSHQVLAAQRGQTFERQGQMCAALVRRHGVDFVDDDRARGRQASRGRKRSRAGCRATPVW